MEGEKKYKISLRGRLRGIRERMQMDLEDKKTQRRIARSYSRASRSSLRSNALANEIIDLIKEGYNTRDISKMKRMKLETVNLIVVEKRKEYL